MNCALRIVQQHCSSIQPHATCTNTK